jgi:hypothetical protein
MGTMGPFVEGKATGAWNWPLTIMSTEIKNALRFTFPPCWIFMVWCLCSGIFSVRNWSWQCLWLNPKETRNSMGLTFPLTFLN